MQAWVPSTQNVTVSHNWFHDVGYGVMAGNDGSSPKYALGTHTGWTVEDNIAEGIYSIGFELTDTSDSVVRNNVIHLGVRDPLYGSGAMGVFSWAHIDQHNLTVSGNTIDGTTAVFPAIYMYAYDDVAPNPNLDGVLIENNLVTATGTPFEVYLRDIGIGPDHQRARDRQQPAEPEESHGRDHRRDRQLVGLLSGPAPAQISGSLTTDPWITCYEDDPAHAGRPGFWPLPCPATHRTQRARGSGGDARHPRHRQGGGRSGSIRRFRRSPSPCMPTYWDWPTTLDPKHGDKVFDHEAKAAGELAKIVKDGSPLAGAAEAVIDTMVEIDRGLASEHIALAAGVRTLARMNWTKALKQLADGDAELLKGPGHEDNAIHHVPGGLEARPEGARLGLNQS